MSEDTQRDEKARLLLEYTENKQEIAQLRTRAARFGDALYEAGTTLRSEPEKLVFERESTPLQYGNPRKVSMERTFFDVDTVIELRDSIRRLMERQRELEPRLGAFGLLDSRR